MCECLFLRFLFLEEFSIEGIFLRDIFSVLNVKHMHT